MNQTLASLVMLFSMLVSFLSGTSFVKQDKPNPQLIQTLPGRSQILDNNSGTLTIASTPAGADIYIDGSRYAPAITPASIDLPAGSYQIELKIPGYETYTNAAVVILADQTTQLTNIVQLPELLPATEIKVNHTLDDDFGTAVTIATLGGQITMRRAITAILNDTSTTHFRIEFADGISGVDVQSPIEINTRGNFTINGDRNRDGTPDIQINSSSLLHEFNITVSEVRLIGLIFTGIPGGSDNTLLFRPTIDSHERMDLNNIYILGSKFKDSWEIGMAPLGAYGFAATEYGGDNTFNVKNFVIAGNQMENTNLFSFAGAGDEDFNVFDGYSVVANQFVNSGCGFLASDAHTWYVFGQNNMEGNGGVPGQIGYSENNIFKNVLISGNYFTLDQNARYEYSTSISVSVANMGNSKSTVQDVVIRNNSVKVLDPTNKNQYAGIAISNSSIGDENGSYTAPDNVEYSDNNTLRNVLLEYNDFEFGTGRGLMLVNNFVIGNPQNGRNNLAENIVVSHNVLKTNSGVWVLNYYGNNQAHQAENNLMRYVTVENNQIIADPTTAQDILDGGVLVAGALERDYTPAYMGADYFKAYGGLLSHVIVQNNTIEKYRRGVLVTGSYGYQHDGLGVDTVEIKNNTIVVKPMMQSYGVEIGGATLPTIGVDVNNQNTFRNGSKNCFVKNVTVEANTITSRGGISVFATFVDDSFSSSIAGNSVDGVLLKDNILIHLQNSEPDKQYLKYPIVIGGIEDNWNRVHLLSPNLLGNRVSNVVLINNTYSGYLFQPLNFANDRLPNQSNISANQVLNWLNTQTNVASGRNSFSWVWVSTPVTNGTTNKYVAYGSGLLGNFPNLISPNGIYVELEGDFANNPTKYNAYLPITQK